MKTVSGKVGFRWAIILVYSDTLFDSRGGFSRLNYTMKISKIEFVRVVAMATNFGTKISITGFV